MLNIHTEISGFTVHALLDSLRIYFFLLWIADSKIYSDLLVNSLGACGQKMKKLGTKKYPDMCRHGLNLTKTCQLPCENNFPVIHSAFMRK